MEFATLTVEPDGDEVRLETLHGREHLVGPVVLVREGVLNGGYLDFSEIERSVPGWNGRPVTAPPDESSSGHPTRDGEFTSANQDPFIESMHVGRVRNVEARDDLPTANDESPNGLVGEIWVSVERAEDVGEQAVEAARRLAEGEQLEVSTGYWHGAVDESGTHDGERYEQVQTDLMPDHLALLPNERGACSWADGCGAPRAASNAQARESVNASLGGRVLAANVAQGDIVEWPSAGDRDAYGRVRDVRREGDEPLDSEIDGDQTVTPPAALIEVYRPTSDGWESSETMVGHKTNTDTLTVIDSFPPVASVNTAVLGVNLLEQARMPEYETTDSGEWSAPDLSDYTSAFGYDDVTEVGDMSDEQKQAVAATSLLGDADADTFAELVFFPVVGPDGALHENALDAVLSGRGAQADISDGQLQSARGMARTLLEDEFGRDLSDDTSEASNILAQLRTLLGMADEQVQGHAAPQDYDPHGGEPTGCACGGSSACECSGHDDDTNMTHDYETLAESTAFDLETLKDMDDETLSGLAETVEGAEDDGGDSGTEGDDGGQVEALREQVETLTERVEDLATQANRDPRAEQARDYLAENTDHDEDDLAEWPDSAALEAAQARGFGQDGAAPRGTGGTLGAQVGVNRVGQAGASDEPSGDEDDLDGYVANAGALTQMNDVARGD